MKLTVLIVGLGQIGMGYDINLDPEKYVYTHARAFSQHPGFELIAGVDNTRLVRAKFADNYDCPAYESIDSALEQHQPDLVVIATPTGEHLKNINNILKCKSLKIILCEKPLSYELDDARKIVEVCDDSGVDLYVNYMRRSDPGAIEVKRRLDSGDIRTPIKGVVWYSKGFYHNGSHFFNLLEYWLGPMQGSKIISQGRLWDGSDPEPDVQVNYARGSVVFLSVREEDFSYYTIELLASNGRLKYGRGGESITWYNSERDELLDGYTSLSQISEIIESGMDKYQSNVVEQVFQLLNNKTPELCSGDKALDTIYSMDNVFSCGSTL